MKNKFKISKYTKFYQLNNKLFLLFNCFSRSIIKVGENVYNDLRELKDKNFNRILDDEKLWKNLIEEKMIVEKDIDEVELVVDKFNNLRKKEKKLVLTIANTMDCNFGCPYCYEINNPVYINDEILEKIYKFIKLKIKSIKLLTIVWIGGEPLMSKDSLYNLTEKVNVIAEKNNVTCKYSIITNGYFLNNDVVDMLKKLNFDNIQITLDGPEEVHNQRRFLRNKKGNTFKKILKNLKYAVKKIKSVSVRMNVDETNRNSWKELKNILKEEGLLDKVNFYLGAVDAVNEHNIKSNNSCMTTEGFSEIKSDFLFDIVENHSYKTTLPSMHACTAISENSYSIDPEGYLYNCWNHIGMKEESCGHIGDINNLNEKNDSWMDYNIKNFKMCMECSILPLCMGHCADKLKKFGPGKKVCSPYKTKLRETVLLYYLSNKKNKAKSKTS